MPTGKYQLGNIPINSLRAFESVGRHCHVRRAADEMSVSHTSLSRHIKNLEEILGIALFDRQHNRLSLTNEGRHLLESVQRAFLELADGIAYLDSASAKRELVVASTATILVGWLFKMLSEFQSHFPDTPIRLTTIEPGQVNVPKDIDIAICLGQPSERSRDVSLLYQERYLPVCIPDLLKNDERPADPATVLSFTLIHDMWSQWHRWFDTFEITGSHTHRKIYVQYGYQALIAARMGMGVMLADTNEVSVDLRSGRLIPLFDIPAMSSPHYVYLVCEAEEKRTPAANVLVSQIANRFPKPK